MKRRINEGEACDVHTDEDDVDEEMKNSHYVDYMKKNHITKMY